MDNINVNPTGSTPIATEEIGGVHYQRVIPVGESGEGSAEVELNWLSRTLMKVFGRFSFDSSSQLRTTVAGTVSIGGTSTLTNITTANISMGDMGKPATSIVASAQSFYGSVGANFTRT